MLRNPQRSQTAPAAIAPLFRASAERDNQSSREPNVPRPFLRSVSLFFLGLCAAIVANSAQAQTQPPTVVEAICLEGGRSASLCACAELRLFDRLGPQAYAQYEAVSQGYLSDPDAGWEAAAAEIGDLTERAGRVVFEETKSHGRAHREEMKACAP